MVMTHQRLNIIAYCVCVDVMSTDVRNPIAYKYREGTMKSTLTPLVVTATFDTCIGIEKESEIA